MLQIDKYAYTNRLSKANPMGKFIFAVILLVIAIIFENVYLHISMMFFIGAIVVFIAKINLRRYLRLFLVPSSFLIISIITILISFSGDNSIFLYSISLGFTWVGITQQSIAFSSMLFFRALACLSATYFIGLTIPMNQLIIVFNKLKMPKVMIEMIILIYRFANIFLDVYKDMQTAIELKFGFRGLKNSYHSVSLLVSLLFLKMMQSYDELNTSLEVKLYNGNFYV